MSECDKIMKVSFYLFTRLQEWNLLEGIADIVPMRSPRSEPEVTQSELLFLTNMVIRGMIIIMMVMVYTWDLLIITAVIFSALHVINYCIVYEIGSILGINEQKIFFANSPNGSIVSTNAFGEFDENIRYRLLII